MPLLVNIINSKFVLQLLFLYCKNVCKHVMKITLENDYYWNSVSSFSVISVIK